MSLAARLFLGASLVKGIPFNPNDPEVSGPDIFKKLVPLEAHKASSLYRFINQHVRFLNGGITCGTVKLVQLSITLQSPVLRSTPYRRIEMHML